MDVHTKSGFVKLLQSWASQPGETRSTNQGLKHFLAWYFQQDWVPTVKYQSILGSVPAHIVSAWPMFLTSENNWVAGWRAEFLRTTGDPDIPDLISVDCGGLARFGLVDQLCRELGALVNQPGFEASLRNMLQAQDHMLMQRGAVLAAQVYRRGLFKIYEQSGACGMSGQFGQTELRIWSSAGSLLITLARQVPNHTYEHSLTYIGEDTLDTQFGVQSCGADIVTALSMTDDVIAGWPEDEAAQQRLIQPNGRVSIL